VRLILVRHGQTEGNVDRRLQGSKDPLTPLGRRQAQELAAHLAGREDVVALYASPYVRAHETARAVGEALGLDPVLRDGLAELDVGDAVGYRYEDWVEKFPEEAERFRERGMEYAWPGGESGTELGERTAREMDHVIERHRGQEGSVVVVSHGGAMAWMVAYLLEESGEGRPVEYVEIENCSITEFAIPDGDRPASIIRRNEVGHLTPEPEPEAEAATGEDPT
jgi:broad specificity phosphatase PhoE